jgi:hypothetical protein
MLSDCLINISSFLPNKEAVRINKLMSTLNLPRRVIIRNPYDIQHFTRWCHLFDTTKLKEVNYDIDYFWIIINKAGFPICKTSKDAVVGWVPPSVKILRLNIYQDNILIIPDTVEELDINYSLPELFIPNSVKKITIGLWFEGTITHWPDNLQELVILGWKSPCSISIPNSVTTLILGPKTLVTIFPMPSSLITFLRN